MCAPFRLNNGRVGEFAGGWDTARSPTAQSPHYRSSSIAASSASLLGRVSDSGSVASG